MTRLISSRIAGVDPAIMGIGPVCILSTDDSFIRVAVIITDEELVIARSTVECLSGS